jgi:hypothetical protein
MRTFAFALLVGLVALYPAGAIAGSRASLIDFGGYSYEDGGFPVSNLGDELAMVSVVDGLTTPLQWDPTNNEYTLHLGSLISAGQEETDPHNIVVTYDFGSIGLYEDAYATGTLADPGVNPPNATAPASYVDGNDFLLGELASFTIFYNTQFNSGAFEAEVTFTGGDHYGDLGPQTTGYTFGGVFVFGIPQGYDLSWDGQILLDPVAVEPVTWGAVKATYAR